MSREITKTTVLALDDNVIQPFFAVELNFDTDDVLRLWTGVGTLTFEGVSWTGAGTLLSISIIEETTETAARGADIGITGIPSEVLSLALSTPYQGRTCKIYFGVLTTDYNLLKEDSDFILLESGDKTLGENTPIGYGKASFNEIFCGYMDQMNIAEGADTGTIQVKVENKLIDLERARVARYTSEYQRSRDIAGASDDAGFDFVASMQDQKLAWGRSSES